MKIKKLVIPPLFFLVSSILFAQNNNVTNLSFSKGNGEYLCRIVSGKRVPFGSIWLPENKRLVIYVRESSWRGDDGLISPLEGPIKQIEARQAGDDPTVVEIIIAFKENRKYEIDYDGFDIVAFIEGDNSHSGRSFFQSNPKKIDRKAPLYSSQKITMDYREADLPNVLRLLAKQNNVNIVAGKDVTGNITISLRNVTLKEALDNILLANSFDYVMDDNIILVKSGDKFYPEKSRTKVFHLKYINAENLKKVIQDMLPEKAKLQVLSPEFYGDQDKAQQNSPNAKAVRKRSSKLIVTDRPEVIEKIEEIVAQLDVPASQIVIESKLLELSPMENKKMGIDWDQTLNFSLLNDYSLPSGEVKEYSALNDGLQRGSSWKLGHLTAGQFNVVLDFLRENTETKLVSNPRVTTSDNITSSISVGTTFPVPQINRGVAGQGDIVTFNYKDVNIQLNVTPHVVSEEEIIMYVNPVIEEVTGEIVIDKNRAPITTKREVSSVITVKNGETIVIGGMIKEDTKKVTSKVFLLGDIPLIGNLFRHTSFERRQKDLVIFITPHILR